MTGMAQLMGTSERSPPISVQATRSRNGSHSCTYFKRRRCTSEASGKGVTSNSRRARVAAR
eukprot:8980336-Pyramimonas_sp.AAC.1